MKYLILILLFVFGDLKTIVNFGTINKSNCSYTDVSYSEAVKGKPVFMDIYGESEGAFSVQVIRDGVVRITRCAPKDKSFTPEDIQIRLFID